jgi:glycerol dehydrogenase-like iron-containing ADH family enzyme
MEADRAFWGTLTPEVHKQLAAKKKRMHEAVDRLQSGVVSWEGLRAELGRFLLPAARIRDCLRRAGGAYRPEHIGVGPEQLTEALLHAHQLRTRFTAFDLARIVGVLPEAAGEIVEEL